MALFRKKDEDAAAASPKPAGVNTLLGKEVTCRVCNKRTQFSKCWLRSAPVTTCPCCGARFEDVAALYKKRIPACPQCGEFLEQPGFEYGICDVCGSKFEIMHGTIPGLLPNKKQRMEMDKYGTIKENE